MHEPVRETLAAQGDLSMGHTRFDRFRRLLVISASRRTTVRAAIASLLLARVGGFDAVAASKRGKRRRRRKARKRERERERLCQQVCGGSCQTCRNLCTACDEWHICYHLTDGPPICKIGVITGCAPCSSDADCGGSQFCVTGITFDGTTEQIAQCGAYSVGVCMEELP
jgi:hypothetical protein